MSAPLATRVDELEARIAFQEAALLELSDAMAAARREVELQQRLLHRLLDEIGRLRAVSIDPASEPPPPHY